MTLLVPMVLCLPRALQTVHRVVIANVLPPKPPSLGFCHSCSVTLAGNLLQENLNCNMTILKDFKTQKD